MFLRRNGGGEGPDQCPRLEQEYDGVLKFSVDLYYGFAPNRA
jgi:hypothetical protein